MSNLDDLKQIQSIDRDKMSDLMAEFPKQCLVAYQKGQSIDLTGLDREIKNIVICGMGGSAIGGDVAKNILQQELTVPCLVVRDYQLPNFVNKKSLVILVSYSGLTAETLSCAQAALKKKAQIIAITSGAELEKVAKKNNWPLIKIDYQTTPRAAISWLLMPILAIFEKLKLVDLKPLQIQNSLKVLNDFEQKFIPNLETEKNMAKYLAFFCFDRCPIILSSERFIAAAKRWANQFNENSKNFALAETLPEIFHNLIEGDYPWRLKDELAILIFDSPLDRPELNQSLRGFKKLLDQEKIRWEAVPSCGDNLFLANLTYIILGDWVSFYLAILNQQNPLKTERIQWLKNYKS